MKATTAILAIAAVIALSLAASCGAHYAHASPQRAGYGCWHHSECQAGGPYGHGHDHSRACCSHTCVDIKSSGQHCGACTHACKFNEVCCDGHCVNLSCDKHHCGACNRACSRGTYCDHGMCDYA